MSGDCLQTPCLFAEFCPREEEPALTVKRPPINVQRELYKLLRELGFDRWVDGCMAAGKRILHHQTRLCIDEKDGGRMMLQLALELDDSQPDELC